MSKYEEAIFLKSKIPELVSRMERLWRHIEISVGEGVTSGALDKEALSILSMQLATMGAKVIGAARESLELKLQELTQEAWGEMTALFEEFTKKEMMLIPKDAPVDMAQLAAAPGSRVVEGVQ